MDETAIIAEIITKKQDELTTTLLCTLCDYNTTIGEALSVLENTKKLILEAKMKKEAD